MVEMVEVIEMMEMTGRDDDGDEGDDGDYGGVSHRIHGEYLFQNPLKGYLRIFGLCITVCFLPCPALCPFSMFHRY